MNPAYFGSFMNPANQTAYLQWYGNTLASGRVPYLYFGGGSAGFFAPYSYGYAARKVWVPGIGWT